MSALKHRLSPLFCMQGVCDCDDREYGLLSNEELMTSVQDAVYEGEGDE